MKKLIFGIATLAIATTAVAFGPAERRAKLLADYQPVGEAVNCVNITQIRSTRVVDDRTIDFRMTGGRTFRNTLPHSCSGLVFADAFSYRTPIGRLCNVDIIRVLERTGGQLQESTGCGLGKFQPVEKKPELHDVSYTEGEWAPFEVVEKPPVTG